MSRWSAWGCSMAETLASSVRQRLLILVLPWPSCGGGVWSGLVVRLGGASNILLGPEETSPPVVGLFSGSAMIWVVIPVCGHAVGACGCLVVAVGCGLAVV